MFFSDVFPIAVALAMDAFALTISNCAVYKNTLTRKKEWAMPSAFGAFQFLMPVIGFYIGTTFADAVKPVAGYITAAVFFALCLKIIIDDLKERFSSQELIIGEKKQAVFTVKILILQAVLTSIDALLIGASSFAFNLRSPFICALIVGAITFGIVSAALLIGKAFGKALGKYAEYAGAAILFALAVKELVLAII